MYENDDGNKQNNVFLFSAEVSVIAYKKNEIQKISDRHPTEGVSVDNCHIYNRIDTNTDPQLKNGKVLIIRDSLCRSVLSKKP